MKKYLFIFILGYCFPNGGEIYFFTMNTEANIGTIRFVSDVPVAGFQFDITGLTLTDADWGSDFIGDGWIFTSTSSMILGFDVSGNNPIPADEPININFSFNPNFPPNEACVTNVVFATAGGETVFMEIGNCFSFVPSSLTYNLSETPNVIEVHIENTTPMVGYQFNISGFEIDSTYGGASEEYDLDINYSDLVVLAFSWTPDNPIPAGDHLLINLAYDPWTVGDEGCLSEVVLSDPNGCEILNTINSPCVDEFPEPVEAADLEFGAVDSVNYTMEVWLTTDEALAGFQFNVTGFTIQDVFGGIAEDYGFIFANNDFMALGYTMTPNNPIPPGEHLLLYLKYNPFSVGDEGCITEIVLSDPEGIEIPGESEECISLPAMPETTLAFGSINEQNNSIEVWVTTPEPLAGFQFELTGFTVQEIFGGIAEDYGFSVDNNDFMVLGYTMTPDNPIPPGDHLLLYIEYNSFSLLDEACLTDIILANPDAEAVPCIAAECVSLPTPQETILELGLINEEDHSIEVWVTTAEPLAGFQFELTGFTVQEAFGGISEDYGFDVDNNDFMVLGYTMTPNNPIPQGTHLLLYIEYEPFSLGDDGCLTNIILANPDAEAVPCTAGECITLPEPIVPNTIVVDGNGSGDFTNIQDGVDYASRYDTVLVMDGIYYENVQINKHITVASFFIVDSDTNHINETIVDGGNYDSNLSPFGSCVILRDTQTNLNSAQLTGFTLQNGLGSRVKEEVETPQGTEYITYYMGGGIMVHNTYPEITYNKLLNNGSEPGNNRATRAHRGGGIGISRSDGVEFDDDRNNSYYKSAQTREEQIIMSDNVFQENDANLGKTIDSRGFEGTIDLTDNRFDIFSSEDSTVSDYWVKLGDANAEFSGSYGEEEFQYGEVYVDPEIGDDDLGSGNVNNPYKTIGNALLNGIGQAGAPFIIHLSEGVYGIDSGERFPIQLPSNVSLIGAGPDLTIIDASSTNNVFYLDNVYGCTLEGLTITGGNGLSGIMYGAGAGLIALSSEISLIDVMVRDNHTNTFGGGLFLKDCEADFENITVKDNDQTLLAGGLFIWRSNFSINHGVISGNEGGVGGGIYINESNSFEIKNTEIIGNEGGMGAGGIQLYNSNGQLSHVLITNNSNSGPGYMGGGGIHAAHSEILLNHLTISNNTAQRKAGLDALFSELIILNSIVRGNQAEEQGYPEDFYVSDIDSSSIIAAYSNLGNDWEGIGNINEDPLFADPQSGDYSLLFGSPCIDTGTDYYEIDGETIIGIDPVEYNGIAPDMGAFESPYTAPQTISVNYIEGWNMVGLPVVVDDAHYQTLFPSAYMDAFYSYDGSYNLEEEFIIGNGYLLRLAGGGPVNFTGSTIYELTLSFAEGWNLISGLSTPVNADVLYNSEIIVPGSIYGYDGSYMNADFINPGLGYWVRANQEGEITLTSTETSVKSLPMVNQHTDANTLELSNGTHSITLYFGKEVQEGEELQYSLPPVFPRMTFDARFTGDMKSVKGEGEIEIVNASGMLHLTYSVPNEHVNNLNWSITTDTKEEYVLDGSGEINLVGQITRLQLNRKQGLPIEFSLHSAYPNPFNPTTRIGYSIPKKVNVRLEIYDLQGRMIKQLVNYTQSPGLYYVNWDGKNLGGKTVSVGTYIYKLTAGDFSEANKIIFLK